MNGTPRFSEAAEAELRRLRDRVEEAAEFEEREADTAERAGLSEAYIRHRRVARVLRSLLADVETKEG